MREEQCYFKSFNPRICKRCDPFGRKILFRQMVSIHASVKDATRVVYLLPIFLLVSIHASVKDATSSWLLLYFFTFCFNPRICKRCDFYTCGCFCGSRVSIHASVKDATALLYRDIWQLVVSIHASVKDATKLAPNYLRLYPVSIHASVKDATFFKCIFW